MIQNHPALRLSACQSEQLLVHLTTYRSYLWQSLLPTPERNQVIRLIQTIQGRLEQVQTTEQQERVLMLAAEEGITFKQVLSELLRLYGTAPPSEQRNQTLGELASLRLLVERTLRQTQALAVGERGNRQ